jgi:hypothetical protein
MFEFVDERLIKTACCFPCLHKVRSSWDVSVAQ